MNLYVKRIRRFLVSYWMPILIIGTSFGLYYRTYFFDFTSWDDSFFVRDNPLLRSFTLSNLHQLFLPGGIPRELLYIPVTYLSFLLESVIIGIHPSVFHLTNTVIHTGNALLIFHITQQWSAQAEDFTFARHGQTKVRTRNSRCSTYTRNDENRNIAFITSLVFVIHPLQVETVAWIMGRKDLLAAFFSLITILAYQKLFESGNRRYYLIVFLAFICALLAKPTAIMLPIILLLVVLFSHYSLKSTDLLCLVFMASISAGVYHINNALGGSSQSLLLMGKVVLQGATIPYLVSGWIMRIFLISPQSVFYSSTSLISAENIAIRYYIPILFMLCIFILALKKRMTALWFGILFTLIAFLPSLSLVVYLNREFFTADRYGYFPLIPMFFVIVYSLKYWPNLVKKIYFLALMLWIIFCVNKAHSLIPVWKNSETLWKFALSRDPTNPIAHNSLGNYYYMKGRGGEAIQQYHKAIQSGPSYPKGYYNLGRVYSDSKRYDMAIKYYQRALKANPEYIDAYYNLGIVYLNIGSLDLALSTFSHIFKLDAMNTKALYCIGLIHKKKGDFGKALGTFNRLLILEPDHAKAHFQSAILYHKAGRIPKAIERYNQSLRYGPLNDKAHFNLALIYLGAGQYDQGVVELLAAKKINPNDPEIHNKLGLIFLENKEYEKAADAFSKALVLHPNLVDGHKNLGVALYYLERPEEALFHIRKAQKRGEQVDPRIFNVLVNKQKIE